MIDSEDAPQSIVPTDFDRNRVLSMQPGERVEAESGAWVVFCYRDNYTVAINTVEHQGMFECPTGEEALRRLAEM